MWEITYNLCERLEKGFKDIEELENDWDSYGADKVTSISIENAKEFCRNFTFEKQPEIAPNKNGGIYLYVKNIFNEDIICEIDKLGNLHYKGLKWKITMEEILE